MISCRNLRITGEEETFVMTTEFFIKTKKDGWQNEDIVLQKDAAHYTTVRMLEDVETHKYNVYKTQSHVRECVI